MAPVPWERDLQSYHIVLSQHRLFKQILVVSLWTSPPKMGVFGLSSGEPEEHSDASASSAVLLGGSVGADVSGSRECPLCPSGRRNMRQGGRTSRRPRCFSQPTLPLPLLLPHHTLSRGLTALSAPVFHTVALPSEVEGRGRVLSEKAWCSGRGFSCSICVQDCSGVFP